MVLKDSANKMKNYFDVGRLKKTAILILPDDKVTKLIMTTYANLQRNK
jgi:hypothetical protein